MCHERGHSNLLKIAANLVFPGNWLVAGRFLMPPDSPSGVFFETRPFIIAYPFCLTHAKSCKACRSSHYKDTMKFS